MNERAKRPSAKCRSMPGACSTVSAERPSLEEWSPQETVPGRRCLSAFAPVLLRSFQSSSWSNVLAHELQRGFGVPRLEEIVALPVPALQSKQALHLPGTLKDKQIPPFQPCKLDFFVLVVVSQVAITN